MKIRERVARAIFDVGSLEGVTLAWEKVDQGKRDFHLELADAAIKATREPTEAMKGATYMRDWEALENWQAMVDAALKEQD